MLSLAEHRISADHALAHLRDYATAVPATIRYYDYAGDLTVVPTPSDGVGMSDIARLVVISAQLAANDVPALLEPVEAELWEAVPQDATFQDLPDNPLHHKVYEGLLALYDAYAQRAGLGPTKITKLLHLKRPGLVPILDSVAEAAYADTAKAVADEFGEGRALYWAAMWRDARRNATEVAALAESLRADGGSGQRLGALSHLRLHDVLVWSHFQPRSPCAKTA